MKKTLLSLVLASSLGVASAQELPSKSRAPVGNNYEYLEGWISRPSKTNESFSRKIHERKTDKDNIDWDKYRFSYMWLGIDPQDREKGIRNYILTSAVLFTSGFFDGTAETLKFHYPNFKNRFPNANDQFWDPNISWTNKYRNGNPAHGPKFLLSTSSLVFLTDGYHLMKFGRNATMAAGITLTIGEKKKWYQYLADGFIKYCVYSAGFSLAYDQFFKKEEE